MYELSLCLPPVIRCSHPGTVDRCATQSSCMSVPPPRLAIMRAGRYQLTECYTEGDCRELFDPVEDSHELNTIFAALALQQCPGGARTSVTGSKDSPVILAGFDLLPRYANDTANALCAGLCRCPAIPGSPEAGMGAFRAKRLPIDA